ncbi:predicted protein [Nematostella vectensis]|uniref:Eukaryotic translation initiation factor 5A n=1 Tax=Nematostella vectensis TaxID=45351 RepID=A7T0N1_NEMVE|nr:eukaryotic translation initiation factor 5A [Nematostella vectensis]EDO30482.1 predicted protein [Nematostella vectensis]|eukprot:XP_001622582.1 predicted protein [Nematostella vectensis]
MAEELADTEFHSGESGASDTYPAQCSSLRKNGHVVIKGRPCKIVEMSTSKTGKHGHAKVHLVALDIFTNKKYEDICPSTHNMNVPHVSRADFQVTNIEEDGYLELMDDNGDTRADIKLQDNDIAKEIRAKFEASENFMVTVLKAMGEETVVGVKVMSDTK